MIDEVDQIKRGKDRGERLGEMEHDDGLLGPDSNGKPKMNRLTNRTGQGRAGLPCCIRLSWQPNGSHCVSRFDTGVKRLVLVRYEGQSWQSKAAQHSNFRDR
jgi:hypothetical protein